MSRENKDFPVIVIGSGPAGLAAAYAAAVNNCRVLLVEKSAKPGMKLLASGGGRCNISNNLELEDFAARFGRNWRFFLPALENFHGKKLIGFFAAYGIDLQLTDGFHYFPASGRAGDILELFTSEITRLGGKIMCGTKADIRTDGNTLQVICGAEIFQCSSLILACGGRGYPQLGGSMAGYELAQKTGHRITPLYPGMTGVICTDSRIGECAGISLPDCETQIDLKGMKDHRCRGELLFTHHGFSAFAILDLAAKVAELAEKNGTVPLKTDFLPSVSKDELDAMFAAWRRTGGSKRISTLLSAIFPRRIAMLLLDGDDPEISHWSTASSRKLLLNIKESRFDLSGAESWEKAMVTAGGVSLKDVSPHTLESKIIPGIFFAGEMLDAAGPCGGFNITWALASGMLAGNSAAKNCGR